jgi:hypothetical protein
MRALEFGHLSTPERCWDISQAYALFAYARNVSEAKNRTLKECRGFLAPRPGCDRMSIAYLFQGYAKNTYPRLSSWRRSAVRGAL